MNRLEQGSFALFFDGKRLQPVSLEKNVVGFCSKCDDDLMSIAYHRSDEGWLVSAQCNNQHLCATPLQHRLGLAGRSGAGNAT